MDNSLPLVISASRRTDLAGCYPDYLSEKLKQYPPERVHTIVIWTKSPHHLIHHAALRARLAGYSQIYVHVTITGLGGTLLEPKIPPWRTVVEMLPAVLQLVKNPMRISWRFDPIISAEAAGTALSNFPLFPVIAEGVKQHGIITCRTSWVSPYKKVIHRLKHQGVTLHILSHEERMEQAAQLEHVARSLGIKLFYCSMEGFARSRCIDGELLSQLHPDGIGCSTEKAKGQRGRCGCTESLDIGWYTLKCMHGCLYCYAEPAAP